MNKQLAGMILTMSIFPFVSVSAQTSTDEIVQPPSTAVTINNQSEPISGAFGITLGKHFEPKMVAKIISEQPQKYLGENKTKSEGKLFNITPHKPDEHFQNYSVKTTADGLIFAIQGEYQYDVEKAKGKKAGKVKQQKTVRKTCKTAVKAMAKELEESYGKPRGKGWDGEWFSFRQITDNADKKISLYANQCRSGLYRIIYTDEKTRKGITTK